MDMKKTVEIFDIHQLEKLPPWETLLSKAGVFCGIFSLSSVSSCLIYRGMGLRKNNSED